MRNCAKSLEVNIFSLQAIPRFWLATGALSSLRANMLSHYIFEYGVNGEMWGKSFGNLFQALKSLRKN